MIRVVTAMALVLIAACAPARPDVAAWSSRWDAAVGSLPLPPPPGADLDRSTCDETVGQLRELRNELLPSPDAELDTTVDSWIRLAEDIFFECPIALGPYAGWDRGYAELGRLQSEIDAFLSAG